MVASEFDIIDQYFNQAFSREDVLVGVGDDCAVLEVPVGKQLVMTTDTMISGVHFLSIILQKTLPIKRLQSISVILLQWVPCLPGYRLR